MKIETAVEWFENTFYTYAEQHIGASEECKWTLSEEDFFKMIEKAKEIETEKRIEAFDDGFQQGVQSMIHIVLEEKEWDGVDDGREYVKVQDWSEMRTRKI